MKTNRFHHQIISFRHLSFHSIMSSSSSSTVSVSAVSGAKFLSSSPVAQKSVSSSVRLCDIGANLTDNSFSFRPDRGQSLNPSELSSDLHRVLIRAKHYGVEKVIVTAGMPSDTKLALEMCSNDSLNTSNLVKLYTTIGAHPTRAGQVFEGTPDLRKGLSIDQYADSVMQSMLALLRNDSARHIVALGEMGLDYDRLHFCPADIQRKYFEKQLECLLKVNSDRPPLPLFLHSRAAAADFSSILSRFCDNFRYAVVHSFTGSWSECEELLNLHPGIFIGINGCSLKTVENVEVAKRIPLDRLLLETDAPYCQIKSTHASFPLVKTNLSAKDKHKASAEVCIKGRCEPCHIVQVLEVVAALKAKSTEEIASAVWENSEKVFFSV